MGFHCRSCLFPFVTYRKLAKWPDVAVLEQWRTAGRRRKCLLVQKSEQQRTTESHLLNLWNFWLDLKTDSNKLCLGVSLGKEVGKVAKKASTYPVSDHVRPMFHRSWLVRFHVRWSTVLPLCVLQSAPAIGTKAKQRREAEQHGVVRNFPNTVEREHYF